MDSTAKATNGPRQLAPSHAECHGAGHNSERSSERPPGHQLLVTLGVSVHQAGLGQRDECPGRRVEEQHRHHQHRERPRASGEQERQREGGATADHQRSPPPHVSQDEEGRFEKAAHHGGDCVQQANVDVRQPEVVSNQRPRGFLGAIDEFINELDGQEDGGEQQRLAACVRTGGYGLVS